MFCYSTIMYLCIIMIYLLPLNNNFFTSKVFLFVFLIKKLIVYQYCHFITKQQFFFYSNKVVMVITYIRSIVTTTRHYAMHFEVSPTSKQISTTASITTFFATKRQMFGRYLSLKFSLSCYAETICKCPCTTKSLWTIQSKRLFSIILKH